jgi:hypothetical protein
MFWHGRVVTSNADRALKNENEVIGGVVMNMITMKATMTRMPTMMMMIINKKDYDDDESYG